MAHSLLDISLFCTPYSSSASTSESEDGSAATGGILDVLLPDFFGFCFDFSSSFFFLSSAFFFFSSSFSHFFFSCSSFLLVFCSSSSFFFFSFSINSAKDSALVSTLAVHFALLFFLGGTLCSSNSSCNSVTNFLVLAKLPERL